jgi:sporulation protein YlmC with PRC-barrel domain
MRMALVRWLAGLALVAASSASAAVTATALIGAPADSARGKTLGAVDDLVIDVDGGRVLYVIVDAKDRYYTLPMRALDLAAARPRVDLSLANALARVAPDVVLRRAARLIGQPLHHTNGERIGTIVDIAFDAQSGVVEQVLVRHEDGVTGFPASVLAHGRFPPLTEYQVEHPGPEPLEHFQVRPSDERKRLHNPEWERR